MPDLPKAFKNFCRPWRDLPGSIPGGIDIFAIGDVHGQADLLEQVFHGIENTPREASKRHVVLLGDLTDRGPAFIRAVNLAMNAKLHADVGHLHVLPGNHDIALVLALEGPEWLDFWMRLGGDKVLTELDMSVHTNSWEEITVALKKHLHPDYLKAMSSGPTHLYLGDLLFVHAGIHPSQNRADFLGLSRRFISMEDHWANIRYPLFSAPWWLGSQRP